MATLPSTNDQYEIAEFICDKLGANSGDVELLGEILEYVDIEGIANYLNYQGHPTPETT